MSLTPGSHVGPYEVSSPLGAGGMGEVWRARDSRLQRDVAIKTLPAAFAIDQARLARFQREAQLLAQLSHPNIAAIYGLEEIDGSRALVMELVEGPTLAERIAAGAIPLDEALAIARQIGAALEAAHGKGVVHRDLKPANIKLTPDGKVKVLDFGLAKALDPETASGDPAQSPTLTLDATKAGIILGTAGYMSPEQARGKPVDKRADIWAFGVVLYEMLTGRMMFEGETVSDTLAGVLRGDIDWKLLPADTPVAVRRLLERCLERDPRRRLRDIGDAWFEIDQPLPAVVTPAAVAAAKPSPLRFLPMAAGAVLAIAGIAWGLLRSPAAPPQPVMRWSLAPPPGAVGLSLSRDGSQLGYMDFSGGTPIIWTRALEQAEAKQLPGAESAYFATFSPDNQWIAYFNGGGSDFKLKKIPAAGGTSITLAEHVSPLGLSWGADDTLVYGGAKGLMRLPSSGGTAENLTTIDPKKADQIPRWPAHLPGNRGVLYSVSSGTSSQISVVDLKTHTTRELVAGANPRYVAPGYLVFFRSGTIFAAPFDLAKLQMAGAEAPLVESVGALSGTDSGDFAIADSGLLVYMRGAGIGGKTVLHWADRNGVTQPVSDAQTWGTGRLSPDGKRIANGIHSATNLSDIWVYDLDRRAPTRLTFGGQNDNPIWSHDGRWITYSSTADSKHGLYRVASDASGKPELLAETENEAIPTSWSPDGKTLVYCSAGADKRRHLYSIVAPGGKPAQLHDAPSSEFDGEISPDGKWIAYQSNESGVDEIYVQPFPGPGGKTRISTQGGQTPRWSHSGKELYYWGGTPKALFLVDVQGGAGFHAGLPQQLFRMPAGTTWDVAPDGKRFLVEISETSTSGRRLEAVVNWFDELRRRAPVKR